MELEVVYADGVKPQKELSAGARLVQVASQMAALSRAQGAIVAGIRERASVLAVDAAHVKGSYTSVDAVVAALPEEAFDAVQDLAPRVLKKLDAYIAEHPGRKVVYPHYAEVDVFPDFISNKLLIKGRILIREEPLPA